MILSIIVPVFNEERHLQSVLEQLVSLKLYHGFSKQIIVVDDNSTDLSDKIIKDFITFFSKENILHIRNNENKGKGFCLRLGLEHVIGDLVIFHDADLEYDTNNINKLLEFLITKQLDAVYGNRYGQKEVHQTKLFLFANKLISFLYNIKASTKLPDVETCHKLIKTKFLKNLSLSEDNFGIEIELSRQLDKIEGIKIDSIPILYNARSYNSGKKIGFTDGIRALWCLLKY